MLCFNIIVSVRTHVSWRCLYSDKPWILTSQRWPRPWRTRQWGQRGSPAGCPGWCPRWCSAAGQPGAAGWPPPAPALTAPATAGWRRSPPASSADREPTGPGCPSAGEVKSETTWPETHRRALKMVNKYANSYSNFLKKRNQHYLCSEHENLTISQICLTDFLS